MSLLGKVLKAVTKTHRVYYMSYQTETSEVHPGRATCGSGDESPQSASGGRSLAVGVGWFSRCPHPRGRRGGEDPCVGTGGNSQWGTRSDEDPNALVHSGAGPVGGLGVSVRLGEGGTVLYGLPTSPETGGEW